MKIGVLTGEFDAESRHENELLAQEIRAQGHETVIINYGEGRTMASPNSRQLVVVKEGAKRAYTSADLDIVIPRINEPEIDSVERACAALLCLMDSGIPSTNSPEAIMLAKSKWRAQRLLEISGIKTPDTVMLTTVKAASSAEALQALEPDASKNVVIKSNHGTTGEGTIILPSRKSAKGVLDNNRDTVLVQRFVKTPGYPEEVSDIRVVVIGDKVISYGRRAKDDYRSNVYLQDGGQVFDYEANEAEKAIAAKAGQVIGLEIAGVDVFTPLKDDGVTPTGELVVNEVNASTGFGKGERLEKLISSSIVSYAIKKALDLKA